MKKMILFCLVVNLLLLSHTNLKAQNWVNGGNTLSANGKLGTKSNYSLIFITNNTERGRITNGGNWGFGTSSPGSKLHVNSASGASPFRASINGSTKLYVGGNGGLSIGSSSTPPSNGLYVSGNVGIGTSTPSYKLHVVGNATITNGLYVQNYGTATYNYSGSWGTWSYGSYGGTYSYGPTYGVFGSGTASSGSYGVYGTGGTYGVYGTGNTYGVYGKSKYLGVYGEGDSYGLFGYSSSSLGVYGSGQSYGVYGYSSGGNGSDPYYPAGVYGYNGSYGYGVGGYGTNGSGVFGYSSKYYAGYFSGNVFTTGSYLPSDRALKQDITDLTSAMDIISQLHPKSYNFRQDGNYKLMNLPLGKHYGLITEDLEQILPSLVKQTKFDTRMALPSVKQEPGVTKTSAPAQASETIEFKALNYTELIPIMIKAMQEQEAKIEALTQLVNKLQNANPEATVKLSGISLGQNVPNPLNGSSTRINYNIPTGITTAELVFSNAAGQKIKQIQLNNSGLVDIDTSSLSAGTYFYTLYINGKSYDTKKMVINR
ncbi:tail fiber domain-containing protein [Segetibacter koreensis]|uniref:tail fiber domain-containing protein n=1 Tax=Segetibacter koreensis TaxID=398037 RepID=UPI0003A1CC14|nr:tail fiber domain-containing protein [Segetibacter koreensis]